MALGFLMDRWRDGDWFGRATAMAARPRRGPILALALGGGVLIAAIAIATALAVSASRDRASTLDQLSSLVPAGAIEVVGGEIQRVAAAGRGTLSFSFLAGVAIAIWGANAGVKALFDAINVAYGATEERGFFKLNLISLAFTIGAILFVLLALAAIVVLPVSFHYLGLDATLEALLRHGRWPLIWLVVAFGLACLYRFGPTTSLDPKWRWISWGSASAATLWLVASALFSWYAANFGSYNKTYGSLGAAIGFMTWIWISAAVIIMGAELNAEIEQAAGEPHAQRPAAADGRQR